jgi:hypothetical protein
MPSLKGYRTKFIRQNNSSNSKRQLPLPKKNSDTCKEIVPEMKNVRNKTVFHRNVTGLFVCLWVI